MAAMILILINFKTMHHCSYLLAATFDLATFFTQAFKSHTGLAVFVRISLLFVIESSKASLLIILFNLFPLLQESSKTAWLYEELNFEDVYTPIIAGQFKGMGGSFHCRNG